MPRYILKRGPLRAITHDMGVGEHGVTIIAELIGPPYEGEPGPEAFVPETLDLFESENHVELTDGIALDLAEVREFIGERRRGVNLWDYVTPAMLTTRWGTELGV